VFAVSLRGWQRVAVVAVLTVPFILVVAALMLLLPVAVFLGDKRRGYVLEVLGQVVGWARVIAGASPPGDGLPGWSGVAVDGAVGLPGGGQGVAESAPAGEADELAALPCAAPDL
jgi:hypothetical protein